MQSCRATHILSFLPTTTTTTATHKHIPKWFDDMCACLCESGWLYAFVFDCLLVRLCFSLSVSVPTTHVVVNAVMGERACVFVTVWLCMCLGGTFWSCRSGGCFFLLCLIELYDSTAFQWLAMIVCASACACVNDVNCSLMFLFLSVFVNVVVVVVVVQRPYLIQIAHFVRLLFVRLCTYVCVCVFECSVCIVEGRRNKIDYTGTS